MTKLDLEIHDDIVSAINKIRAINDSGIELIVPENSVLFENIINLKIIQNFSENLGLNVIFTTQDEIGNNLISMLDGDSNVNEFVESSKGDILENTVMSKPKFKLKFKMPNFKKGLIFLLLLGVIGAVVFFAAQTRHAYAKIVVNSQALTRSLTVKVKTDGTTNPEQKILRGFEITAEAEEASDIETTGEKIIGEKAEGKATIYNKTTDEKKFKKGAILTFDKDDEELNFITQDDVTVPASAPEDPEDPASALKPGSAEVDVVAEIVGETYNLAEEKALGVDGQKKASFEAEVSKEIKGGKSEKVKIVAQSDIDKLKEKIKSQGTDSATNALKRKVELKQAFIDGSTTLSVTKETFSHKLGEETDKLTLTQTVTATGLVYLKEDLSKLTDTLVQDLIPEGFELSDKDRDINVEVLGNSNSATLTAKEADIQVTLKSYIVTKIDENSLKERLKGKSFEEGQKVLGGISNVKTYELKISPSVPLINKVPTNPEKIEIDIVRE